MKKIFNLRFPEPFHEKLKFVVERTTYKSMQEFIMAKLEAAIEGELRKLGVDRKRLG
jgi:hypothetical protein